MNQAVAQSGGLFVCQKPSTPNVTQIKSGVTEPRSKLWAQYEFNNLWLNNVPPFTKFKLNIIESIVHNLPYNNKRMYLLQYTHSLLKFTNLLEIFIDIENI